MYIESSIKLLWIDEITVETVRNPFLKNIGIGKSHFCGLEEALECLAIAVTSIFQSE